MAIYSLDVLTPHVPESAWVAESASVIGDVVLGELSSVWYGTVVRGDNAQIRIGKRSNIQDNCTVHVDVDVPVTIGDDVCIGHQVMLHGCTIGDGSLIGIQAVILNRARIGRNCLVGAGSVVTEGKEFPDGSLILGSPARAVRALPPEMIDYLQHLADSYVEQTQRHRQGLKRIA
jgi:carbonic anhydrase/acetyltransferase-like protein (isoleucine patch superfamily)